MPLSFNIPAKEEKSAVKGKPFNLNLSAPLPEIKINKHDVLFGTGLTKRDAISQEKQSEKVQALDSYIQPVQEKVTTAKELHLELPTNLVDDNMVLDPSQIAARNGILNNKYACLIGAAGTGKTTTLKVCIQAIVSQPNPPMITLCAYTGRAVQQIKRALPAIYHDHCDTIHGLLEYAPEFIDKLNPETNEWYTVRQFVPHRTRANKIAQEVIFVDETGMFAIDLWHKMLAAKKENCRIYFIGDINQLPPVHGRSVLGFAMKKWPTFALDRIHRTKESGIIDGAWDILHGKTPKAVEGRVALIRLSDNSLEAFKQTISVVQKLNEGNAFNPLQDAIITPQNDDTLGQRTFNDRLCAYFNQPIKDKHGNVLNQRTMVTSGVSHHAWAVGDKIMATQNDRDEGITNGMIGVIESLVPNERFQGDTIDEMAARLMNSEIEFNLDDIEEILPTLDGDIPEEERERQSSHIVTVKFQNLDQPVVFNTSGTVNTLMHAYAFTCHKSQGGEYPVVIIVCHSANFRMLCREWLYTAWTRAQEKVILLYNSRGLAMALNNQRIKGSSIQEKAEAFNKLQERNAAGEDKIIVPRLPEPEVLTSKSLERRDYNVFCSTGLNTGFTI